MEKVKVCFVVPLPPPYGGIANWSAMMRRFLDKEYSDKVEYTFINSAPKKRMTEGRNLFDRIVVSGFDMLGIVREVKKTVKKHKPACIHITTSGSLAMIRDYFILKYANRHGINTAYHIRFGKIPKVLSGNNFQKRMFTKNANYADTVIAIDKKTYEALCEHGLESKARLIPNPIYLAELPEPAEVKDKVISFVGWLVKQKGIEELLEAWERIVNKGENDGYKLRLIGPYKEEYLNELKKRFTFESVEVTGELEHTKVLDTVNESKGFVLPSYSEGFPNAVLEAMALKTTVIGSKVGAIPEMLEGDCGLLIEPQNVDSLYAALTCLIKDDSTNLTENAYKKATSIYSLNMIINNYMEVWQNAVR